MSKNPVGRKTKLNDTRLKKVVEGITAGLPYDTACALAGICYQTFLNWMKRGEAAQTGKFFEFFEEVKKAEAIAESVHIANIKKAGKDGVWQADAWMLERRFPEKWGRREQVKQEISGPEGEPLKVVFNVVDGRTSETRDVSRVLSE